MSYILVIDDDEDLLELIEAVLVRQGHIVKLVNSPLKVSDNELLIAELIILDVMMPSQNGFEFLSQKRYLIDAPVIFLTARDFEEDIVMGLSIGADDYIVKPFSNNELRARVDAHLRREQRVKRSRLIDGPIACDLKAKQFYVDEFAINLTMSEYLICELLMKNKEQTFTKESIYNFLYGMDGQGDYQTSITERIKQIRQQFRQYGVNPIRTVWGIGYKWEIIP
ncbi:response regulator transcription factor [Vaginisenegalia massiliensis]|uniref:response regulator transcription factor n=1 Tax=Vaginisenegalia massiliensis TaxID=2058294 RepID=UPI000F546C75|nr:response regulator transcription factor [Vaginisenegalia massiliensis]